MSQKEPLIPKPNKPINLRIIGIIGISFLFLTTIVILLVIYIKDNFRSSNKTDSSSSLTQTSTPNPNIGGMWTNGMDDLNISFDSSKSIPRIILYNGSKNNIFTYNNLNNRYEGYINDDSSKPIQVYIYFTDDASNCQMKIFDGSKYEQKHFFKNITYTKEYGFTSVDSSVAFSLPVLKIVNDNYFMFIDSYTVPIPLIYDSSKNQYIFNNPYFYASFTLSVDSNSSEIIIGNPKIPMKIKSKYIMIPEPTNYLGTWFYIDSPNIEKSVLIRPTKINYLITIDLETRIDCLYNVKTGNYSLNEQSDPSNPHIREIAFDAVTNNLKMYRDGSLQFTFSRRPPTPYMSSTSPTPYTSSTSPTPYTSSTSPTPYTSSTSPTPYTSSTSPTPYTSSTSPTPYTSSTSPTPSQINAQILVANDNIISRFTNGNFSKWIDYDQGSLIQGIYAICSNSQNSLYVAVGGNFSSNNIIYSMDGITWLSSGQNSNKGIGMGVSAFYSNRINKFIVGGQYGSDNTPIATSTDGKNWTYIQTPTPTPTVVRAITESPTRIVAVCGQNRENNILWSDDGVTWNTGSITISLFSQSVQSYPFCIAYSNKLNKFVVGCLAYSYIPNVIAESSDGNIWKISTNITLDNSSINFFSVCSIIWSPKFELFIACVQLLTKEWLLSYSFDGINWISSLQQKVNSIFWSNSLSIFIGIGYMNMYTSIDGKNWLTQTFTGNAQAITGN